MWLIKERQPLIRQSDRAVRPGTTSLEWFFFFYIDLHAFKVNWFLIHPVLVQTQGHRSPISSLTLAQTHLFFFYFFPSLPSRCCETYWSTDGRIWHCSRLHTPHASLHYVICVARIPRRWLYLDYSSMLLRHIRTGGSGLCWNGRMVYILSSVCFAGTFDVPFKSKWSSEWLVPCCGWW